jgi:type II secretory pathway component GspD/PulD (secretin)
LFRPVILLPRPLAEQLPPAQLRAVLLHELIHIRRGDVWVNCAQALLQIVYWWHPLLWLANARIRRVREEAVDDAVMLALNEDAETYAPTLLEVAKLALHRPLASLGLVGILESRSSLRQRIERLMDFRPPRKAGLTLASVLAVLGVAALAVPMGEAPAPTEVPQSAASDPATRSSVPQASTNASLLLDQIIKIKTLVQDGKLLYEMGKLNEAEAKLREAVREDPQNQTAAYYLNLVSQARHRATAGLPKVPPAAGPQARTNTARISDDRRSIMNALNDIRLDRIGFDRVPLSKVVQTLADKSRKRDPRKLGVNLVLSSPESAAKPGQGALDPAMGQPKAGTPPTAIQLPDLPITIKPPVTDVRLADVLDLIVKVAGQPIKYSIESYAVVFSAKTSQESPPLYVRTFMIDPNTLIEGLHVAKGSVGTNGPGSIAPALLDLFAKAGADLDATRNPGKSLFYNDRQGMLIVRATMQDLDIIEAVIQVLNTAPPQVNIKCMFMEIPQDDTKALGFDWYLGNTLMTNGGIGGQAGAAPTTIAPSSTNQPATSGLRAPATSLFTPTGILTDPQFRVVIKALQQRGAELLAAPEITTLSGRQAQMKTADSLHVVTGINERALTPPGITTTNGDESALYVTKSMEFGPTLDVTASVLADGYTIALTVIPTVTEFLGYVGDQTNRVAVYVNGKKEWVIPPRPNVRQQQMTASVRVWDGQTVVLGGLPPETVAALKDQVPVLGDLPLLGRLFRSESKNASKKNLLVFVTPTLIDPAGNRIHSEEEMLARDRIPPQPPH